MPCRNCKYYDENERSGQKGYCEYYRRYYYEDDNCSHYVQRSSSGSSGCFFTTACCVYKGLPDDCHQLTVLRAFRDNYLKLTAEGVALTKEYYEIAPSIVSNINNSESRVEDLENIFCKVEECVCLIENNENQKALELYISMVNYYKNKYRGE